MSTSTNMPQPAENTRASSLPNQDEEIVPLDLPRRSGGWELLWRGTINKICLAVVAFYILVGLVSLLPSPADMGMGRVPGLRSIHSFDELVDFKYHPDEAYSPPSRSFVDSFGQKHYSPAAWFGFDFSGHSVFWQVFYGARTALLITVLTSVIVLIIGTTLGLIAGYFGGWIDDFITWVYSVVSAVPWLLLVIAVTYTLQQNAALDEPSTVAPSAFARAVHNFLPEDLVIVILSLGLTDWVSLCRLIRGETLKLRDSDMVAAGRAVGLSELRIIFRHILPNVSHLLIITFTLGAVGYLQVEVVLAFLGLGVSSKPSWGHMIDDAKMTLLRGVWWEVTAATAAIFIICMALTILGDALRDALDPKLRGRD
jgi:ABC-type dipeptide/oligopeptide/nickel transport system permease subunit